MKRKRTENKTQKCCILAKCKDQFLAILDFLSLRDVMTMSTLSHEIRDLMRGMTIKQVPNFSKFTRAQQMYEFYKCMFSREYVFLKLVFDCCGPMKAWMLIARAVTIVHYDDLFQDNLVVNEGHLIAFLQSQLPSSQQSKKCWSGLKELCVREKPDEWSLTYKEYQTLECAQLSLVEDSNPDRILAHPNVLEYCQKLTLEDATGEKLLRVLALTPQLTTLCCEISLSEQELDELAKSLLQKQLNGVFLRLQWSDKGPASSIAWGREFLPPSFSSFEDDDTWLWNTNDPFQESKWPVHFLDLFKEPFYALQMSYKEWWSFSQQYKERHSHLIPVCHLLIENAPICWSPSQMTLIDSLPRCQSVTCIIRDLDSLLDVDPQKRSERWKWQIRCPIGIENIVEWFSEQEISEKRIQANSVSVRLSTEPEYKTERKNLVQKTCQMLTDVQCTELKLWSVQEFIDCHPFLPLVKSLIVMDFTFEEKTALCLAKSRKKMMPSLEKMYLQKVRPSKRILTILNQSKTLQSRC